MDFKLTLDESGILWESPMTPISLFTLESLLGSAKISLLSISLWRKSMELSPPIPKREN